MANTGEVAERLWCRGRLPLYVVGFALALVLDPFTPLGIAEWLIEVFLVCLAAIRGGPSETLLVAVVASVCTLAGLLTSPVGLPLWLESLNRMAAVGVIWVTVQMARQRHRAEAQIKILRGLLPICADCKRIRSGDDQWQSLETYIRDHSEATFTHSLCPVCFDKYSGQIDRD